MKIAGCSIALVLLTASSASAFSAPAPAFHRQHGGSRRESLSSSQMQPRRSLVLSMSSGTLISSNEELLPGIEAINVANDDLFGKLETLRDEPYFRLYSVDILGSCEYIPQELFECYSESCEIYPIDEDEVRKHLEPIVSLVEPPPATSTNSLFFSFTDPRKAPRSGCGRTRVRAGRLGQMGHAH